MARRKTPPKIDAKTKLLAAYLAWWESDNGKLVLADLKQAYHDRCSVAVDFDPNRALVTEACRSVYLGIVNMVKEARKHAAGNDRTEYESDFSLDADLDAAGAGIFN